MDKPGDKGLVKSTEGDLETWLGLSRGPIDEEEQRAAATLRPQHFAEYIGQENIKDNLLIGCGAAKKRGEALDHLLLHGPPGLGRTWLAKVGAHELGVG